MSVHSLPASRSADPVTQARIQLAAAHRMAVLHELEEGIDNHFTVTVKPIRARSAIDSSSRR